MDRVESLGERLSRAEEEESERQIRLDYYRRRVDDFKGALERLPDLGAEGERTRLKNLLASAELEVKVWTEKVAAASSRADEIGRKFREERAIAIRKKLKL